MRIQRHDDDDIRELFRDGSSSWAGPSPLAHQSRWAAVTERQRRVRAVTRLAAGFGFAAVVAGSLTLVVTSQSPNGAAASVARLVSHVLPGPPGAPAVPLAPGSSPTPSAGSATPSAPPAAAFRSTPRPSGARSGEPERRLAPASPSVSAFPSPLASRPPDE